MKILSYRDQISTEVSHQTIFWPSMSGKIIFIPKDGEQGRQTRSSMSYHSWFLLENLRSGDFSVQTNIASKLRKLESCDCAQSKVDDESFIFFFWLLFFDNGKVVKIIFKECVFFSSFKLLPMRDTLLPPANIHITMF